MNENLEIFDLQAKLCQTLGQTARLKIINLLKEGPHCVTDITERLEMPQSTVSRHLAVLRSTGILSRKRKGSEAFYEIASPKIVEVCEMMRQVLAEQDHHHQQIFSVLQK